MNAMINEITSRTLTISKEEKSVAKMLSVSLRILWGFLQLDVGFDFLKYLSSFGQEMPPSLSICFRSRLFLELFVIRDPQTSYMPHVIAKETSRFRDLDATCC